MQAMSLGTTGGSILENHCEHKKHGNPLSNVQILENIKLSYRGKILVKM